MIRVNIYGLAAILSMVSLPTTVFAGKTSTTSSTSSTFCQNQNGNVSSEFSIAPGYALSSDGKGFYVNNVDYTIAVIEEYAYLKATGGNALPKGATPIRSLSLDLSQPVAGGGGTNLGVLTDPFGTIQVYYQIDNSTQWISHLTDIPVGSTVTSQQLQIVVRDAAGNTYLLLMATSNFPYNYCNQSNLVYATGSTPASITRNSTTQWIINSPAGSVGHLYKRKSSGQLVDVGLYYTSFSVELDSL